MLVKIHGRTALGYDVRPVGWTIVTLLLYTIIRMDIRVRDKPGSAALLMERSSPDTCMVQEGGGADV
jgi:hypothetical protein